MPIRLAEDRTLKFEQNGGDDDLRKLKYGEGSITLRTRRNKDGTERRFWQGRYFVDGRQRSVYGRTQAECLAKLKQLKEEYKSNEPPKYSERGIAHAFYSAWLDEWLLEFKQNKVRPSTMSGTMQLVERIKSALGGMRLARIKPMDILKYLNTLPRSNTAVKIYNIINGSLQKAEDFGYIRRNPCRAVERPRYEKQKRRAFELAEQSEILAALEGKHKQAFFFMCCTGLRIGEFLALRKENIDYVRGCLNIVASENVHSGEVGKTKTAAGKRRVYFASQLFDVFDVDLLGSFTYSGIKKAFGKAYAKAGLEGISLTHSCRHTYASMLYAAGVSDKVIQGQLGHASVSTTLDIYTDILLVGGSPIYEYISALKRKLEAVYMNGE